MNITASRKTAPARSQTERRTKTRILAPLRVNCLSAEGNSWPALAVNLSASGTRMVCFLPQRPDPFFTVQLVGRQGFAMAVLAHQVQAHGDAGIWIMGCVFERPLSEDEIKSLVPPARKSARRNAPRRLQLPIQEEEFAE